MMRSMKTVDGAGLGCLARGGETRPLAGEQARTRASAGERRNASAGGCKRENASGVDKTSSAPGY